MKQIFFLVALLSLACPFMCCKTKKQASTSETSTAVSEPQTEKYRLIISFISKGAGVDGEKRQAILNYIEKHPKKPVNKPILWGREGETDFCLNLKELSKSEQETFISEIKKIAGNSDLIFISENAECQHKGR
jgi:hypothetical protein